MIPRRLGAGLLAATMGGLLLAGPAAAQTAAATALPAPSAPDTVRTNLWLTEALMAEIVATAAQVMPEPPAAVRLVPGAEDQATELFGTMAARLLMGRGYDLYVAEPDSARQAAADVSFGYEVLGVELLYPDVGRTLGLWRRWVERDLAVTAMVEVTEDDSGRVLLKQRLVRVFNDRVPDGDFPDVNSPLYDFTSAEPGDSGWQGRIEEIVVLGALAGLVAIYFANTRD